MLDAYAAAEIDRAIAVWNADDEVDEHYNALFRELLTYMMGDPRTITRLHPPAVHGQEPGADRRPRHQHRRDHPLRDHRRGDDWRTPALDARRTARPTPTPTADDDRLTGEPDVQPYVLVMEDEDALATLLQYNLEKEGYRVVVAADGEEGLLQIDERLPDLVLLDWMLPKLSGIEVCRRLRGRRRDAQPADHHADRPRRGNATASAAWTPAPTTI